MEFPKATRWVSEALRGSSRHQPPCKPAGTAQSISAFLRFPAPSDKHLPSDILFYPRMLQTCHSWPWLPWHSHGCPLFPCCHLCQVWHARAGWFGGSHVSGGTVRGAASLQGPGGTEISASFGLSAEGSASPRWEQAGGRVACGGGRARGGGGIPLVALPERHRCAQLLLTPQGCRCCVGFWRSRLWNWCPGIPLPAASPRQKMEGWDTPQNPPSSPRPGIPCRPPPGPALPWHSGGQERGWHGAGGAGAPRAGRRTPAARIPRWLRLRAAGPGRGKMLGIRVPEQTETGANTNNK